ncbi:MAG TPA: Rdx family protein [Candidatus Limnocylindria bacterium]
MSASVRVRIVYCADCGYEPRVLALAGALMREFHHRLTAIELMPFVDGMFDVRVGDELVHSMEREGGFPTAERVVAAVRSHLAD